MKRNSNQSGFTYVETMMSLVIVTVGLLGSISALTYGFFYMQSAEKKTKAKEFANSTIETIFAVRDINSQEIASNSALALTGWDMIQTKATGGDGIFVSGWYPVRSTPGPDGLIGTTDDSCPAGSPCNDNAEITGYSRKIDITDIVENGLVRKRLLTINIKYTVGKIDRTETISTIIANLPFK